MLKVNADDLWRVGRFFHGHAALMARGIGRVAGIFQLAAFKARVHHVGVHAVALGIARNGNAVLFSKGRKGRARHEVPFAPGGDNLDVGRKGADGKFKTHLIVALAGGTMGHGIGAFLAGDVHKGLGDERAGNGGSQQVAVFVAGRATHHGKHKVLGHFFAQIKHIGLGSAGFERLFFHARKVFGLAEVGGNGNDLALVGLDEPFEDNRSIKPARIGENDFFNILHVRSPLVDSREKLLRKKMCEARALCRPLAAPTGRIAAMLAWRA